MSFFIAWGILIFLVVITSIFKKKRDQAAREKRQQMQTKSTNRQVTQPNVIVERAKKNTQDVHQSHVAHERESMARGYGGGPEGAGRAQTSKAAQAARPISGNAQTVSGNAGSRAQTASGKAGSARQTVSGKTGTGTTASNRQTDPWQNAGAGSNFGEPDDAPAPSGIPVGEEEWVRRQKAQVKRDLQREREDVNSRRGRNSIMEAAKENALEARLDNLEDSEHDLMQELQDLMVKGPNDTLSGQRDFVAEGMEMVNEALMM